MVKVALLPAKPLLLAKTRLGPLLEARERMAMAGAMFTDVLNALNKAAALDTVIVITADPNLALRAHRTGAVVVDEGTPLGLNGAVGLGTEAALRLGATSVLVVLSDIPLVLPADIDELLARAPVHGALVVPSKEGTGTNAMLRQPPTIFPSHFGGRSLERYVRAAERSNLTCEIVLSARIGFDLDTPEDLRAFAARESPTETYRAVLRLGSTMLRPSA